MTPEPGFYWISHKDGDVGTITEVARWDGNLWFTVDEPVGYEFERFEGLQVLGGPLQPYHHQVAPGAIYQTFCTEEDPIRQDFWMDVSQEAYENLKGQDGVRCRVVYLGPVESPVSINILRDIYEWYDRDGSVGGASDVFEDNRSAAEKALAGVSVPTVSEHEAVAAIRTVVDILGGAGGLNTDDFNRDCGAKAFVVALRALEGLPPVPKDEADTRQTFKMSNGGTLVARKLTESELAELRKGPQGLLIMGDGDQWRDIASAPKDGTTIIVFDEFQPLACSAYWDDVDAEWRPSSGYFFRDPVKWIPMPIPAAPKEPGQ